MILEAEHPQDRMAQGEGTSSGGSHIIHREDILRLMKRREDIDEQIQALGGILTSNKIGMTEPLVDSEGYPRNDIDVYQVRHARHKIICLQTDFKNVTKEIDEKLQMYHTQLRERGLVEDGNSMEVDESTTTPTVPIAKVNLVSEGSPAYHAGLQVDDMIVEFGSINAENYRSLSDIGQLVQSSAGNLVNIKVKRVAATTTFVKLALIPGPWNGRGLLGCNIVPFEAVDR